MLSTHLTHGLKFTFPNRTSHSCPNLFRHNFICLYRNRRIGEKDNTPSIGEKDNTLLLSNKETCSTRSDEFQVHCLVYITKKL